ncbi:MAG: PaaI family thioesterase [Lentisphaeria bacterium]|nr:PaaI family thioesterase [Lentisphaeria bacterium]MBR7118574.1 PaaI family thioesterase [Lentisphaeria bacterium]
MSYFDTLKDQLNQNDIFCRENSIRLTEIREGYAEAVMSIDEHKLNANNVVQGGAIFTLADFAFAGAANSFEGTKCSSMSSTINFLRPGSGNHLSARSQVVNRGKRSCLVETEVFNDSGKLVAKVTTTGFFI